jgi:hypothetical protein
MQAKVRLAASKLDAASTKRGGMLTWHWVKRSGLTTSLMKSSLETILMLDRCSCVGEVVSVRTSSCVGELVPVRMGCLMLMVDGVRNMLSVNESEELHAMVAGFHDLASPISASVTASCKASACPSCWCSCGSCSCAPATSRYNQMRKWIHRKMYVLATLS